MRLLGSTHFDGSGWFLGGFFVVAIMASNIGGFALYCLARGGTYLLHHNQRVRQRRIQMRLCAMCGYDLRANKERCPECGLPIPARPESASA